LFGLVLEGVGGLIGGFAAFFGSVFERVGFGFLGVADALGHVILFSPSVSAGPLSIVSSLETTPA
jgi:hypothetical protein